MMSLNYYLKIFELDKKEGPGGYQFKLWAQKYFVKEILQKGTVKNYFDFYLRP